jgi:hypothetical protein
MTANRLPLNISLQQAGTEALCVLWPRAPLADGGQRRGAGQALVRHERTATPSFCSLRQPDQ